MMPYAAYLRIYEPLSAFSEPDRTRWAAYATSAARSRRMSALAEEYAEALRRVATVPPVLIPERESEHAYVRWLEGVTYVCPWQTRLRSWLALGELRATAEPPFGDAFAPLQAAAAAASAAEFGGEWASDRVHIRTNTWTVPITWFVPFAATERRMAQGEHRPSEGFREPSGQQSAVQGVRGVVPPGVSVTYMTTLSQARRRVSRSLAVARGAIRQLPGSRGRLLQEALGVEAELTGLDRWLAEFHPYSLIELDYGGLVCLLSEQALRADESAAEISAAIEALARSEWEVALAMHQRVVTRWRVPRATACAN
ncbi:MAG: hypothetical protein ABSA93_13975 [Streptosporangiaceae bacterium]|jgi:hypothetical protein